MKMCINKNNENYRKINIINIINIKITIYKGNNKLQY
jgi:hypothetical protein